MLRLSVLLSCCGLLGLTTACSSSEDPTPTKTTAADALSDLTTAKKNWKQQSKQVEVERTATGTVRRAGGMYLIIIPDGAKKKVFLSRDENTEVSGIKEYWHDLDAGYRVDVTWIQSKHRALAKQIVVLSKGNNTKPPLSELEAELENPPAS